MKRYRGFFFLAIFIILSVLLLAGPIQKSRRPVQTRYEHLAKISIAKSNQSGNISKDFFMTVIEPDIIRLFEEMLEKADEEDLKDPIVHSDYDLHLTFSDQSDEADEWVHLYLGNIGERSAFVYHGYEDMAYFTSREDTKVLYDLLGEHAP